MLNVLPFSESHKRSAKVQDEIFRAHEEPLEKLINRFAKKAKDEKVSKQILHYMNLYSRFRDGELTADQLTADLYLKDGVYYDHNNVAIFTQAQIDNSDDLKVTYEGLEDMSAQSIQLSTHITKVAYDYF